MSYAVLVFHVCCIPPESYHLGLLVQNCRSEGSLGLCIKWHFYSGNSAIGKGKVVPVRN